MSAARPIARRFIVYREGRCSKPARMEMFVDRRRRWPSATTTGRLRRLTMLAWRGDRHEVLREVADAAREARLSPSQCVCSGPHQMALRVEQPWRRVLVVVPDVLMPDRDLDRAAKRDQLRFEASCAEHGPERPVGVVDDVLVGVPYAVGRDPVE